MDSRNYDNTGNRDDRLYNQGPARSTRSSDITDPERDQERLRPDEATIDLPEVKDIPGQEHVHVPALGELADTTISSDDEEGAGLLDDLNEDDTIGNNRYSPGGDDNDNLDEKTS